MAEETSERKRISIPKVDQSVLDWWDAQHDVGLSVRMLIRAEIERSGYADVAFQPVAQLPRRGRPPGQGGDAADAEASVAEAAAAPAARVPAPAASVPAPTPAPAQPEPVLAGGMSPIDAIMNS